MSWIVTIVGLIPFLMGQSIEPMFRPDLYGSRRLSKMPVSEAVTIQRGEWMGHHETELRQEFLPALVERSEILPRGANVCSIDSEQLYSEDKLGCARGVVWA